MGLLDWLKGVLTPNKIPVDIDVEPVLRARARPSEAFSVKLDLPRPPKEAFEYWSDRVKYLKQSDALQRAVEEGLREVTDETHRGRIIALAAKRSVDCTLEKIAKLKTTKTKLKNLEACRKFVVSLRAHGLGPRGT